MYSCGVAKLILINCHYQSLVTGRPPSLLMSYIDCHIPTAEDETLFQEGEVPLGCKSIGWLRQSRKTDRFTSLIVGIWGFRASSECLVPLVRLALAVKPPSYDAVMELDRKIRDFSLPKADSLQTHTDRTAISMQTFVRSHYQELSTWAINGYFTFVKFTTTALVTDCHFKCSYFCTARTLLRP